MDSDKKIGAARPGQLKLIREPLSGHCHRVELFISLLDIECEMVDIDVQEGEAKTEAFKRLNFLMEVPVLWHGDLAIADSNAILLYLALLHDRGVWLPRDPLGMSRVQRWLSIAAGELVNGPVSARRIQLFKLKLDPVRAQYESMRLLEFLEQQLRRTAYLAGDNPTIADIALYTYVSHSPEGGIDLRPYTHVLRWLDRVEEWPRFVPMLRSSNAPPLLSR